MNQIKSIAIKKGLTSKVAQFAVIVGIATIAPLLKQQAVTGSLVNAMLFVAVVVLGAKGAILAALTPSLIALSVGLLPVVLAPMIPFIMVGNVILILAFDYLRKKSYWLAAVFASVLKFLFLFSTSSVVIDLLIKKELSSAVAGMMNLPQLFTALGGSLLAFLFLAARKPRQGGG